MRRHLIEKVACTLLGGYERQNKILFVVHSQTEPMSLCTANSWVAHVALHGLSIICCNCANCRSVCVRSNGSRLQPR